MLDWIEIRTLSRTGDPYPSTTERGLVLSLFNGHGGNFDGGDENGSKDPAVIH